MSPRCKRVENGHYVPLSQTAFAIMNVMEDSEAKRISHSLCLLGGVSSLLCLQIALVYLLRALTVEVDGALMVGGGVATRGVGGCQEVGKTTQSN